MSQIKMSDINAKKRGYVLDKNGIWRQKTVLERYLEKGYLDLEGSPFTAEQRKHAGEILARDYYLGSYEKMRSVNLLHFHIRTTGNVGNDRAMYYKERYLQAVKNIPYEYGH